MNINDRIQALLDEAKPEDPREVEAAAGAAHATQGRAPGAEKALTDAYTRRLKREDRPTAARRLTNSPVPVSNAKFKIAR